MLNQLNLTIAEQDIRAKIAQYGRITFAEFMELALYHPTDGYYTNGGAIGAAGDYYTSPAAHPVFGAMIAIQLQQMWETLGHPERFYVIETGSGTGRLAADLMNNLPSLESDFVETLRYVTIERSFNAPPNALAIDHIFALGIPINDIVGCLISNELIDAFPVHRFLIDEGKPRELYVTENGGNIVEEPGEPSTPALKARLDRLSLPLPNGFRGEVNLGISPWIQEVSKALMRGFILTIDYGHLEYELYSSKRDRGTMQTFYNHVQSNCLYKRIGHQDITCQVDFSSVIYAGEQFQIKSLDLITQSDYLQKLGIGMWIRELRKTSLSQSELYSNLMAMRQLIEPAGLGNFKVLIQEKNTGIDSLQQILPDLDTIDLGSPPLLSLEHIPLLEGRYPHTVWKPENSIGF